MNRSIILSFVAGLLLLCGCGRHNSASLFDGVTSGFWHTSKSVFVRDTLLILSGPDARALLKQSNYRDFELTVELSTSPGGRGAIWFHTNPFLRKGYRVAIQNDLEDSAWWRMTGSLLSVRNLTKSFVADEQWFTLVIRVEGSAVSIFIDGQPVVEYVEPEKPYRIEPNEDATLSSGTFALLGEGPGEIRIRHISVKVPEEESWDQKEQLSRAIDERHDPIIRLHQADFPVLDYHVHLKGGLTREEAARQSRRLGINYAVSPNCGVGFPIESDKQIRGYLDTMRTQPFLLAMQAEGREWQRTFSAAAREQFDFVFTDALTFVDDKDRRSRIWIPEETWIGKDEELYMDMLLDRICDVLQEPVDVYVNPCFLPEPLSERYDELWTEERMDRFIEALVASGKALEINELYRIPNKAILMRAKAAGVKFTFGSNNITPSVSDLSYSLQMKEECGITAADMYKPPRKRGSL